MRKILILHLLVISGLGAVSGASLIKEKNHATIAFFNEEESRGLNVTVKGIVQSAGVREVLSEKDKETGRTVQDKTKITVRLYDPEGINTGGTLYVINDHNLVVAKLTVIDIFKSRSFDYMCFGYGNFRAVKKDFKVVQRSSDNTVSDAYLYIAKAYREIELNDLSKAIEFYQKAIQADRENPEAHTGLGYVYLGQKMIPFAIREFDAAYKARGRVYDKEDRFMLLKGCAESRYNAVFQSEFKKGHPLREKYLNEGIKFAKEACSLFGSSGEAHFMLGKFYYDRSTDAMTKIETENDLKAVDEFQKSLEFMPDNSESCIIISKIYKKHGNRDSALKYIEMARGIDPANQEAISLEKIIKKMK